MPTTIDENYVVDGVNIQFLARRQRWVLWLILASILSIGLSIPVTRFGAMGGAIFFGAFAVGMFAIQIAVMIGTVALMWSMKANRVLTVICALLMFIPWISFLILLLANGRATRRLRRAGLKVGFMGVSDEQVVQKLSRDLCRKCGYNLTGNVSGVCSECGTSIRPIVATISSQQA
jgi:hypothetical protein